MTMKIEKFNDRYTEITGPAGCGKTTQAHKMRDEIARSGVTCLIVERERDITNGFLTNKRPTPVIIWDSLEPPSKEFRERFLA